MKRALFLMLLAALPLLVVFADEELKTDPVGYAPAQPIAYSHKTHLALGLKCNGCHAMKPTEAGEGFSMGFPKEAFCMGCHTSVKKDSPGSGAEKFHGLVQLVMRVVLYTPARRSWNIWLRMS